MRSAFSLVELSIVLVILGLLTGGILTGQNLIRAAELRAITTEFQSYKTAVNTFRDKYFALPGDMRNAEDFWGTMATGTCPNATAGTGTQTCNGNGDGKLNGAGAASQTGELYTFWQQLANAGMIEGSYTGIAGGSGANHHVLGENAPRSKISNAGWLVFRGEAGGVGIGTTEIYAIDRGSNFMEIGAAGGTNDWPTAAVLTPEEAWNIDTKMDDGRPAYGKVTARYWNNLCSAANDGGHANNDLDADYRLTDTSAQCTLMFLDAF